MSAERRLLWLCLGLAVLGLGGCAVVAPEPEVAGERVAVADWTPPAAPERWRLRGRAALEVGGEAATVSLFWRDADGDYRIDLRGALGAGSVRVESEDEGVALRTGDGSVYRADSARELVRAITGYDLPVEYLRWWVRGQPVPWLDGEVRVGEGGLPQRLDQDGWTVRYEGFLDAGDFRLPQRLGVTREDVDVRLLVRRWEVEP